MVGDESRRRAQVASNGTRGDDVGAFPSGDADDGRAGLPVDVDAPHRGSAALGISVRLFERAHRPIIVGLVHDPLAATGHADSAWPVADKLQAPPRGVTAHVHEHQLRSGEAADGVQRSHQVGGVNAVDEEDDPPQVLHL